MKKHFSDEIKTRAIELGFEKVGISRAESISKEKENLEAWINDNGHASMEWVVKRKKERGDIHSYFPDAKSVISVGMNYYNGMNQSDLNSDYKFSNYAWGDDYHEVLKVRLISLLEWVKVKYPNVKGLACVDTSPLMEKVWAQKAGLGWQGKHTNLITKDYGSWLFLGELVIDMELHYDLPFEEDLCGTCMSCIEACPTQALTEYKIHSEKCISYKTIECRDEFFEDDTQLDNWIYGCDICQEVCPWNLKFNQVNPKDDFNPREEILSWKNIDWENLNESIFKKVFKGSAAKRAKFSGLKRNVIKNSKQRSPK